MKQSFLLDLILSAAMLFIGSAATANADKYNPDDKFYKDIASKDMESIANQGRQCITNGNNEDAIAYYSVVAARYSQDASDDEKKIYTRVMNDLGYLHFFHSNDPIRSYHYLIKALGIAEETGDSTFLPHIYVNLANIYCTLDDYDSAVENFKKSFHSSISQKTNDIAVISMIGLANIIYSGNRHTVADMDEEIQLFNKSDIPASTPLLNYAKYIIKGIRLVDEGNYREGIASFQNASENIDSKLTPERYRYVVASLIARAYMMSGEYPDCERILKSILRENNESDIRAAVYHQLWECYKKTGQTDSVARYSSMYLTLSDTLLHAGQLKTLRDIESQNNIDKFNHDINSITKTNKDLLTYGSVISVMFVMMMLLGIWLWRSRVKLLKSNKELYNRLHKEIHMDKTSTERPAQAVEAGVESKSGGDTKGNNAQTPLAESIRKIMSESSEIYNQDFSIENLAALADSSVRKVSQAINSELGMNFSTLLQEYRIKEACRRLEDRENYGGYTIEAISESLGFKSRGNFVNIFKKITGLTPSSYQKISRQSGNGG